MVEPRYRRWFLVAAFLNTCTDLGHKIILQNTAFKLYDGAVQIVLMAVINALMLLPFVLLLAPAGRIADRYAKLTVMRHASQAAVACCGVIVLFYYLGWFLPALLMTLALAVQAAIFSPAKYGFIREAFGKEQLSEINGLLTALSIGALVASTFFYTVLFEHWYPAQPASAGAVLQGVAGAGWCLLSGSLLELYALYRIAAPGAINAGDSISADAMQPQLPLSEPASCSVDLRPALSWSQQLKLLLPLWQQRNLRLAAIGLSVLWATGQIVLASFPAFVKEAAGVTNALALQGLLACAGIGIGLGAVLAGRYSRNYIETGLLPLAAAALACGLMVLPTLTSPLWLGVWLLMIGFAGGVFIVPLNAWLQYHARPVELGLTLAASNWLQNLTLALLLVVTLLLALLGLTARSLLLLLGVVAVIGAGYTLYQLPQSLARLLLGRLASSQYRIKVQGMRHIPAAGGVLLLGNHVSWIDWAVVQIACPRPVRFVMSNIIYELWYLNWFFKLLACIPIQAGASSHTALDAVATALRSGEVVCLFPEGVISRNGQLTQFRKGFERACTQADDSVVVVPFFLRGLWGAGFARAGGHLRRARPGLNREVVVDFGQPLSRHTGSEVIKQKIRELSNSSWEEYADNLPSIGAHWVDTCCRSGNPRVLLDTLGASLRAKSALAATIIMGRRFRRMSPQQNVGLLLPSSTASVLGNLALTMLGKTVVNLNFTASTEALLSSVMQAEIRTIYTSRKFLDRLSQRGVNLEPLQDHAKLVMLEDFKSDTAASEKLLTLAACWLLPAPLLKLLYTRQVHNQAVAVILFSSGSEGAPKGITLTHRNLLANVKQITELLNFDDGDVVLANLPPFHAFGLTVTHFMPMLERVPLVCHADPTDVYGAAQAIATYRITMLFGTCSFYRLYNRNSKIHPLMLQSLRLCIAGAEKLQEEVRKEFKLKFNKDILEGYGATETAPVASVNMPDHISPDNWQVQVAWKPGSVGMPLPGTAFRIVDPHTFLTLPSGEAGMILLSGAQVMPGYLKNEARTSEVLKVIDGRRWYVTGDKGYLDSDGFLFIIDRYSRFAKISGEMVGLGAVESAIKAAVDQEDFEVVVVSVPDARKGERLIALATIALDAAALRTKLMAAGMNTLALPAHYALVEAIPKLGSGKTDFTTATTLALALTTDAVDSL